MQNIRIVLVNTSHPGNIGAAARAMKVMGCSDLVLVNPVSFPDAKADAMATGAKEMLQSVPVVSSLADALVGCEYVFATTARPRSLDWSGCDARECAQTVVEECHKKMAIVFGRERTGLTNEELALSHRLLNIPTADDFHSLNLAQAVQVVCYELCMARRQHQGTQTILTTEEIERNASMHEMAGFYDHLKSVMLRLGFMHKQQSKTLMQRLMRLFNRSELSVTELNIMRGFLSAVEDVCPGEQE